MSDGQTVRIACEISVDLNNILNELIPWGCKSEVMNSLLQLYVAAVNEHGKGVMMALLDGDMLLVHTDTLQQVSKN